VPFVPYLPPFLPSLQGRAPPWRRLSKTVIGRPALIDPRETTLQDALQTTISVRDDPRVHPGCSTCRLASFSGFSSPGGSSPFSSRSSWRASLAGAVSACDGSAAPSIERPSTATKAFPALTGPCDSNPVKKMSLRCACSQAACSALATCAFPSLAGRTASCPSISRRGRPAVSPQGSARQSERAGADSDRRPAGARERGSEDVAGGRPSRSRRSPGAAPGGRRSGGRRVGGGLRQSPRRARRGRRVEVTINRSTPECVTAPAFTRPSRGAPAPCSSGP